MNNTFDFLCTHADTQEMKHRLLLPYQYEINLSDGILDAKTMGIRAYTKEDYKFQKLPYSSAVFETYTPPQKWLNFLNEILE